MTPRQVRIRPVPDLVDELPPGLHPVLRRALIARGVHRSEQLDLSLGRMHRPDLLGGVQEAAQRIADAVSANQRITIVGDFDADGATGVALAIRALRAMGAPAVDYCVPNRFEFGYGLSPGLVNALPLPLPDLLVTVDNGITSHAGVETATGKGISVIVTDHHMPGDTLPGAAAIVNPNLPGDRFPSKALAGVGVMFYLLLNLRKLLREADWFNAARPEPNLAQWLDLVALGTVADLVPLDRNNRVLVQQGLERIRRGSGVLGIQALLHVSGRHFGRVQAADLGFAVGPRLNAAGRLEDMRLGIECLLCDDLDQAVAMAQELDSLNRQRRAIQSDMQEQALAEVSSLLADMQDSEPPAGVCLYRAGWHQGVVGLVASKIKDALHRPTVAFAPQAEDSVILKGSARSIRGVHIRDILAAVDSRAPGLMENFGGHAMAAGLSLQRDRLDAFRALFEQCIAAAVDPGALDGYIVTDGEIPPPDFGLPLAQALRDAGPWGQRFSEPLFEGRFHLIEQRVVADKHLKMVLQPPGGDSIDAIAFNTLPDRLAQAGTPLRVVYRLDVNEFRGRESAQMIIEHIF